MKTVQVLGRGGIGFYEKKIVFKDCLKMDTEGKQNHIGV